MDLIISSSIPDSKDAKAATQKTWYLKADELLEFWHFDAMISDYDIDQLLCFN